MKAEEERESIRKILEECREIYSRNLSNTDRIDSKITKFFTLILALILLFINLVEFPPNFFRYIYVWGLISFVVSLILLILAYKPREYGAIDPEKLISKFENNAYDSSLDLSKAIAGMFAGNVKSIKEINKKKSQHIKVTAYFILFGIICIVILKAAGF